MTDGILTSAKANIPPRRTEDFADSAGLRFWWLGQAGFLIETADLRLVVDPYLSDYLATKYRGARFSHTRMVPPPIRPEEMLDVDVVVVTHAHSDHLDPWTLPVLAENNPLCRFVVPASCADTAVERGLPDSRLTVTDAGIELRLSPSVTLRAIPSAHEGLSRDAKGRYLYLGYLLFGTEFSLYHSGDCVPYEGLEDELRRAVPTVGLLPINGRDDERANNGVPGNFTLDEAVSFVARGLLQSVVGHHFGLFDFNTIDEQAARSRISNRPELKDRFVLAELGVRYEWPRRSLRRADPVVRMNA